MLLTTLSLLVLLITSVWLYGKYCHSYWAQRGIPSPPATPVLGHIHKILFAKPGRWVYDNEVYRKYNRNGLAGVYSIFSPLLYVSDPELLRHIFVKDFDHFTDRRLLVSPHKLDQPMNEMLSNVNGDKWKTLRHIMTPTFTSGKMRNMFQLVSDKADALVSFSLSEAAKKPAVNMKYNFGRFTIDTIATCAFGLECNSLVNEEAVFPKKAMPFFELGIPRILKLMMAECIPKVFRILGLRAFPEETAFFQSVVEETLATRRKGVKRGDFLDLLLDAQTTEKNSGKSKEQVLDDMTIVAQSILFIVAGYDTTALTLAFASYLLSKNPDKQQRLRQELQDMIQEGDGINYQGIMEAKYLDSCIMETLRLFPPASMIERICSKDYKIPGTEVTVKRGQCVMVPAWAIHHDEKYWPEPEAFRPERFMPQNKDHITHYTHMPFGAGPRNCIAMRFALMEAKVALAKLVLAARMKLAPGFELDLLSGGQLLTTNNVDLIFEPLGDN